MPTMLSFTYVLNPDAPTDVDAISETVVEVFKVLSSESPMAFDLRGLKPSQVEGEHLAAVLRALYTWRHQVPGWHSAFMVAKEALGDDAEDALWGL